MTVEAQPLWKFRPIRNRVAIRAETVIEQTPGGIFIPERSRDAPTRGVVVGVGCDVHKRCGWHLAVGDRVLFQKLEGDFIRLNGEELISMDARHVHALVEA